jgi:ABC-type branched-subunit amino acid transport system permease subunit
MIRAGVDDMEMARGVGIPVSRLFTMVFLLGATLAGIGGVLGIVIYLLISPVTFFVVPSEVRYMYEDLDGGTSPVRGIYGLWILLPILGPIIWFVQVQGALNRYWESKGASPA